MAKINYYLDPRTKKVDGTSPLKVVVNTCNGNFMISTGISLLISQWDTKSKVVVKHPNRNFLNAHLSDMLVQAEAALISEKKKKERALTKAEMKNVLLPLFVDGYFENNSVQTVFKNIMNDNRLRPRTKEMYATTLTKIELFTGYKAVTLQFEDITMGWLTKFDQWLVKDCPSANARAIHMRNLRAAFNRAIDDDITCNYPFRKFKILKEPTRKRSLTLKQMQYLINTPFEGHQKKYVDIFLLMFYLRGINAVDLLTATKSQIVNGRLEYKRAKTGVLYSVKIEPEAQEIIDRYKGKAHLLKFCDTVKNYKDFLKRMNICLNKIIPGCSTYWARHTCATLASEIDIPLDIVARMLGHVDSDRKITLVYVDFNKNKTDEANRKVIDYVLNKKEKKQKTKVTA